MQWKPIDESTIVRYRDYLVTEKTEDYDNYNRPYFAYFASNQWWNREKGYVRQCYPDFYIELPPIPTTETEL